MAAEPSLAGCTAYIYDENGFFLLKTRITGHDGKTNEIEFEGNSSLGKGMACKVVVDTSPLPWEYMGRVRAIGTQPVSIVLYNGKRQEADSRRNPRFKAITTATIESLIDNGGAYALHTPLEVGIVDISQSGVRISTSENVIAVGIQFEMRLKIGAEDEWLIAETVNSSQTGPLRFEYGCSFLGKSGARKGR